ncbi:MAG: type 4a pilus biogenesis protein PilO [Candidatus Omnitrophica bacterium]|nr:type 4a pilus biogenesis protein PilO [Candidatus Omnitrophota bacterium]MBU4478801.1 type 4a pilus biogenesis protein PilO [Candidatus Omnitrophota bacterium]MCG2702872.1 type 4a pilus biogenesis protein PilO [Candidatus Omnitrophota bacterium]
MAMPKINLPQIQTKYKIIALMGACAVLFVFYHDHAYKPHAAKIKDLRNELLSLEDTIKIVQTLEYPGLENNNLILNKIEEKKKYLAAEIKVAEGALSSQANFSKMLEKITQLANEAGIEIKALEPKDVVEKENYLSMSLIMDINGRFYNLLKFITQMKSLPIYLESLQISTLERPALTMRLQLSILAK